MNVSDRSMDAMLRRLRSGMGNIQVDENFVGMSGLLPKHRRLETVDVMLELSEKRLQDFSISQQRPELLRFSLDGVSLRLFTVATVSDPLCNMEKARDSPGRVVWILDSGEAPSGLKLLPNQFFAAR